MHHPNSKGCQRENVEALNNGETQRRLAAAAFVMGLRRWNCTCTKCGKEAIVPGYADGLRKELLVSQVVKQRVGPLWPMPGALVWVLSSY